MDTAKRMLLAAALFLAGTPALAETVTTTYPDGAVKEKYTVDAKGRKHGPCRSFFPNGKTQIKARYKNGQLDGKYTECSEKGEVIKTAIYLGGKLNGLVTTYEKRKVVRKEAWFDGFLAYPRPLAELKATLKKIHRAKVQTAGELPKDPKFKRLATRTPANERAKAMRVLMEYRYLCQVPYEDLVLDKTLNAHTQATCELFERLDRSDHYPPNPGMPEDEYKFAARGASNSNLMFHQNRAKMDWTIGIWMGDSEPHTLPHVGHRRWCLNPAMQKTGISTTGRAVVMWAMDQSRKNVPDYDFVAFPARGYMPTSHFKPGYAWSVSLNPGKYQAAKKDRVKVSIYPINARFARARTPLKLNYYNVSTAGMGIPNCVIFRPDSLKVSNGSRYEVEITGLKKADGSDTTVRYIVHFVSM